MKNQGLTLIELLIYIAILSSVLVLITGFFWNIALGYIKETSYQEVQQNARFALTKITQETKKTTGINHPPPGTTAAFLSLTMADISVNPTVFDAVDGKLKITQGSPPISYYLTSDQVIVSSLQFTNLTATGTLGTIRIEMTIDYTNPSGRIEYQASINLKSTVSLIPGGAAP